MAKKTDTTEDVVTNTPTVTQDVVVDVTEPIGFDTGSVPPVLVPDVEAAPEAPKVEEVEEATTVVDETSANSRDFLTADQRARKEYGVEL